MLNFGNLGVRTYDSRKAYLDSALLSIHLDLVPDPLGWVPELTWTSNL